MYLLYKLIAHNFSAAGIFSNLYVGPLPRIKISFSWLSICEDELISAQKFITFLPASSPIEKNPSHIQNICTDQHQHILLI